MALGRKTTAETREDRCVAISPPWDARGARGGSDGFALSSSSRDLLGPPGDRPSKRAKEAGFEDQTGSGGTEGDAGKIMKN